MKNKSHSSPSHATLIPKGTKVEICLRTEWTQGPGQKGFLSESRPFGRWRWLFGVGTWQMSYTASNQREGDNFHRSHPRGAYGVPKSENHWSHSHKYTFTNPSGLKDKINPCTKESHLRPDDYIRPMMMPSHLPNLFEAERMHACVRSCVRACVRASGWGKAL